MSRPAPICTILSFLGGPKALLVPQGFVPPTRHTSPRGKRPHKFQGRALLMNQALNAHLSDEDSWQGFVPPIRHIAPHGKRPHTYQGRAPVMNQALDTHLSDKDGSPLRVWVRH